MSEPEGDASAKGLAEAVCDVVSILRSQQATGNDDPGGWDRIVRIVAEHGGLPGSEVEAIEEAIVKADRGWSDAQRRSIWYETEGGMTDDCGDDAVCDTSFNGIGYALQVEMLDEVTAKCRQRPRGRRSRPVVAFAVRLHE